MGELGEFFGGRQHAFSLYMELLAALAPRCPEMGVRVGRTQISLTCPKVFGAVSMARVRRGLTGEYIVVTFGLHDRVEDARIDVATEPHPHRWTHHVVVTEPGDIDEQLLGWLVAAYDFARRK